MSGSVKKFERTTQEQLQFFMQFCREHPELQAGKNNPNEPRLVHNLWEEVASNLNAMRGATRSAAKWKESLGHWKNQLRSRARKTKADGKATGGGPRMTEISDFEQQALETFGAAAVDGFPGIGHLGFQESAQTQAPMQEVSSVESPSSPMMLSTPPESAPTENANSTAASAPRVESSPSLTFPSSAKRKKTDVNEIIEVAVQAIKAREIRDEKAIAEQAKRDELLIEQQQNFNTILQKMSDNVMVMSQVLQKFGEKLDTSK